MYSMFKAQIDLTFQFPESNIPLPNKLVPRLPKTLP